jgi:dimethylaniline monooxygenase (N-oxide forming)
MPSPDKEAPLMRACVIGAGPSGLVAAKYILSENRPCSVTILENSQTIGGTFSNKVYDNVRLVSSKYVTAFSDHRMAEDWPDHPSAQQYVDYLGSYCDKFGLRQCIKFQCEVTLISDAANGSSRTESDDDAAGYSITYIDRSDDEYSGDEGKLCTEHFDLVAVCSGLHNVPHIPSLPNQDTFRGTILHSSSYKDPSIFDGKRVLICGSGETAMDIAHRAVMNPICKSVALNVRRGFLSIPHNIAADRPLDVYITNLFEHAYEHPWINALGLRWWMSTIIIRIFLFLAGSSVGFNQWACETHPIRRGYHIINKSHSAMAHLNVPVKRKSLLGRFWMKVYGEENLRPIDSFHRTVIGGIDNNGVTVRFEDGQTFDADVIILATGYRQSFPFLDGQIRDEIKNDWMEQGVDTVDAESANGECQFALKEDLLPSQHFIVSKSRPRLGFIGFVRPNVGAIPPMSEIQMMWWLCNLRGQVQQLSAPRKQLPSYMVLGKKYAYGVDYGNYMHRIAEDIGAAPTLSVLAKSPSPWKALYTYCQGQAHIPLFRLQGPYASKQCWEILTNELWCVCVKRGWVENIGLASVTWISLWMNLCACVVECVWGLLTARRPKFFARYG